LAPPKTTIHESDQESESTQENGAPSANLLLWPEEEVQAFANEVAEGLTNVGTKGKRLSLSALVALLDNIPEQIRQDFDLQDALDALKEFTRLPRQHKVEELLKRLQTLANQAISAHCLPATAQKGSPKIAPRPRRREEHDKQEERATGQAKTKALAKWPKTFVSSFKKRLQEQTDLAKSHPDTKVEKGNVLELAKSVPAEVALFYPLMMASISAVETDAADMVATTIAQAAFEQLAVIATDAAQTNAENATPP